MTPADVIDFSTSTAFLGKCGLSQILRDNDSVMRQRLYSFGITHLLTTIQSVSLLVKEEFIKRDAEFIRRCFLDYSISSN